MGGKNSCCSVDRHPEYEEKIHSVNASNGNIINSFTPKIDFENENLEHFEFSFEKVCNYIDSSFELKYSNHLDKIKKIPNFDITEDEINELVKLDERGIIYVLNRGDQFKTKKFILKALRFNYGNEVDIENKIYKGYPLQYFENTNLFKEVRMIRNHKNSFYPQLNGYCIHEKTQRLFFVYENYENSLEGLIKENLLDFQNKIRVMKTLLELIKSLHVNGVISLDLSVKNLRFTQKFGMKLVGLSNSFDLKSVYDIDRNSKIEKTKIDAHTAPELLLKKFDKINWNCDIWTLGVILSMLFENEIFDYNAKYLSEVYKDFKVPPSFYTNIHNIYIKSMIIGILRIEPSERPNIFEVIDVYNLLIKQLCYDEDYKISYTKDEVLRK